MIAATRSTCSIRFLSIRLRFSYFFASLIINVNERGGEGRVDETNRALLLSGTFFSLPFLLTTRHGRLEKFSVDSRTFAIALWTLSGRLSSALVKFSKALTPFINNRIGVKNSPLSTFLTFAGSSAVQRVKISGSTIRVDGIFRTEKLTVYLSKLTFYTFFITSELELTQRNKSGFMGTL